MFDINYRPAVLKDVKKCYVEWYVRNPETGKMKQFRKYLDSIKLRKHRLAEAKRIINEINKKLLSGWSPFTENPDNEQFNPLRLSVNRVVEHKLKVVSETSRSSLRSRFDYLNKWLVDTGNDNILCSQFTVRHAMDLMRDLIEEKQIGNKTHNNYLTDYRAVFNYLTKRGHFAKNPFLAVERLRETEVRKQAFAIEDQRRFSAYIKENDFDFYVISCLVYYCAIRPVEITRLRVSDVLENGFLLISGKTNKTDRVRMIQVPEPFNEELQTYVAGLPADWYLFGENLKPGPTTKYRLVDRMTDKFRRYRKRLKLPATVTLYSLKDTGGERLIENGFNPKQIRDHMGHSDLAMTDKYIKKRAGQVDEKLLREFPRF